MFLNQLEEDNQKLLFAELATLVMIASRTEDAVSEMVEDNESKFSNDLFVFIKNIEEKEIKLLEQHLFELDFADSRINNWEQLLIAKILGSDLYTDRSSSSSLGLSLGWDPRSINVEIKGRLQKSLESEIKKATEKYSDNEEIKKEIVEKIVLSGGDILKIDAKKIKRLILGNNKVQHEILTKTAEGLLNSKEYSADLFITPKEKKTVLFELINTAYSSGKLEELEITLLKVITEQLGLESHYFDTFSTLIEKLSKVKQEASTAINA